MLAKSNTFNSKSYSMSLQTFTNADIEHYFCENKNEYSCQRTCREELRNVRAWLHCPTDKLNACDKRGDHLWSLYKPK